MYDLRFYRIVCLFILRDFFITAEFHDKRIDMITKRPMAEVSTSSMADIAFLLLTFFLVTTIINNDRGIMLLLPPIIKDIPPVPIHERNIFKIQINSADEILIESEPKASLEGLREEIKKFILNNGLDKNSSDSPKEAVVSIKTDRGTSYKVYLAALDEAQAAYYEIYAARVGLSPEEYRKLDTNDGKQKEIYESGKSGIPMNISIAEPTSLK
jgi:biopolymer transport protein ExbD